MGVYAFHTQAIAPHDPATGSRAPSMNHILVDRFVNSLADNLDLQARRRRRGNLQPRDGSRPVMRRRSNTQLAQSRVVLFDSLEELFYVGCSTENIPRWLKFSNNRVAYVAQRPRARPP
jgi:hypothetical protein